MTYGQIAAWSGSLRGARQVARILHSMSEKHGLPWHRVVNAKGEAAIADEALRQLQLSLLREEGVPLREDGSVDLAACRHIPDR